MKPLRIGRRFAHGALALLLISGLTGCATTRHDPPATGYKGPVEDPKKKTVWWSVLGFIVTPIGKFFSANEKN